jgi:hypothetical protein
MTSDTEEKDLQKTGANYQTQKKITTMKAILEFDLPEDEQYFECASRAKDLYLVLWEMDEHLRAKLKYGDDNMSDETYKALDEARDHLRNLMDERRVNFEMLR